MELGGLWHDEALKMVTLNPAMELGIDKRVGTIDVGKDADLAIYNHDPLSAYAVVQKTLIDGRVYFDRQRDIADRPVREKEKKALLDKQKKAAEKKPESSEAAKKPGEKKPEEKKEDKPKPPQSVPVTQLGLREMAGDIVQVGSAERRAFNPDVVAPEAVLPSSEHIPVTRAAGITEVLAVPASGGLDSAGAAGVLGGQASAIHLSGWTINDMLLKKSVAMVLNWPEIETQTFDFSTFSRKQKSFADAKQEYEKQVDELTHWLERARHYAQALGHGAPRDFRHDGQLDALVPVPRRQLTAPVFAAS